MMKPNAIENGNIYEVTVGKNVTKVCVDSRDGETAQDYVWNCTTLTSGKPMRIKDAARFIKSVKDKTEPPKENVTKKTEPEPTAHQKGGVCKGKMSGLDAAAAILAETGESLNVKQITELAIKKGYWAPEGKTPSGTIASAILREITNKGEKSRFEKTGAGLFTRTEQK